MHQPLIGCPCILQTERHDFVAVKFAIGDECSVFLVSVEHEHLLVTRIHVHEVEKLMTRSRANHLVDSGHRETIIRIGLVEVGKVPATYTSSVWLRDQNMIRNPIRVLCYANEPCPDELIDFVFKCLGSLGIE